MKMKYIAILACLGILMLMLAGCQGYRPPKYKSPGDEVNEDTDDSTDADIDISELDDDFEEVDDQADYQEMDDKTDVKEYDNSDTYEPEPYVPPAATVQEEKDDTYQKAEYRTIDDNDYKTVEEKENDYTKAPYQPLYEDETDDSTPTLTVTEGDTVKINVKATDQDGDTLTYTFGSPLNSDGEWRTRTGDSGVYTSTIIVSDGKEDVKRQVKIVVEPENNKPVLTIDPKIVVNEGETVNLRPSVYDGDGDRMTISYSGWMTSDTKVTNYQDAGTHTVKVTVSDGISKVSQEVEVVVNDVNRPPEVEIEF